MLEKKRKLIAFILFYIAITIALFVGKMTEVSYVDFGKWLFIAFAGSNVIEHFISKDK